MDTNYSFPQREVTDHSPIEESPSFLSEESIEAMEELGMIYREIREKMEAEGYTMVDGKIVKREASQNHDQLRSSGKEILTGN